MRTKIKNTCTPVLSPLCYIHGLKSTSKLACAYFCFCSLPGVLLQQRNLCTCMLLCMSVINCPSAVLSSRKISTQASNSCCLQAPNTYLANHTEHMRWQAQTSAGHAPSSKARKCIRGIGEGGNDGGGKVEAGNRTNKGRKA